MIPGLGIALASAALYAVICLFGACLMIGAAMLAIQIARKRASRLQAAAAAAIRPELHKLFVQFLAGSPDDSGIRSYLKTQRQEVVETLLRFQSTVSGGARDRMCHLALDLGLVHEWCLDVGSADVMRRREGVARLAFICAYEPCRRVAGEILSRALEDEDEEVSLSAGRGMAQTGLRRDLEDVFLAALGPNPFTRAVLTEELRRHAMKLCAETVPEVLNSGESDAMRGALEIVTAWERAIPIEQLQRFLNHQDRGFRVLALRLAPLASPDPESRTAIARALEDADPEIRSLAAVAAKRLNIDETKAVPVRGGA